MEKVGSILQQSTPSTFNSRLRETSDRKSSYGNREANPMATATIMNPTPTGPYHSQHSSYSPSFPNPFTAPRIADMIYPVDSRRTSDASSETQPNQQQQPHKQSLPSLSDLLLDSEAPYPHPTSLAHHGRIPAPLPSPFGTMAPSRPPFPDRVSSSEKKSSPGPLHPQTHAPFQPRSGPPPPSTFAGASQQTQHPHHSRLSPSTRLDQGPSTERDVYRPPESSQQHLSNGYPQAGRHEAPPQPVSYPPAHIQHPLTPQFPVSPGTTGAPPLSHSYDNRGSSYPMQQPYNPHQRNEYNRAPGYDTAITRSYEVYHILDYLNRAASSSRTIQSFANHWAPIIQETHGNQAIPARLPRLQEISDMINNADHLKNSLEQFREILHQSMADSERARCMEAAAATGGASTALKDKGEVLPEEPMDASSNNANSKLRSYSSASSYTHQAPEQVKKRRGRAAPPGRCHSCNRSDTPEWRRGPDGARTLCNACGLHFAKLNKKRQADARAIRPNPESEE